MDIRDSRVKEGGGGWVASSPRVFLKKIKTCKEASLLSIHISSHLPTLPLHLEKKCSVLPGCTLFESELEFSEG